jgi:hypothetical protein
MATRIPLLLSGGAWLILGLMLLVLILSADGSPS